MKKLNLTLSLAGAAWLLSAGLACASPIYGTPVAGGDYSGSRTTGAGQLGIIPSGTAAISWLITDNNNGTMNYAYKLVTSAQNVVSHFILDLSDNCANSLSSCMGTISYGADDGAGSVSWGSFSGGGANPGLPGVIDGIKLDETFSDDGVFEFSFNSPRVPVWGDFYAKGGQPANANNPSGFAVWNLGLDPSLHGSSDNKAFFIAVPDSVNACNGTGISTCNVDLPESGSGWLMLVGLIGLSVMARRRLVRG